MTPDEKNEKYEQLKAEAFALQRACIEILPEKLFSRWTKINHTLYVEHLCLRVLKIFPTMVEEATDLETRLKSICGFSAPEIAGEKFDDEFVSFCMLLREKGEL